MKSLKIKDSNRLFLEGDDLFVGDLGVDIRGFQLNDVTQLQIWIPVPERYGPPGSYQSSLPSEPRSGECKEQNSKRITPSATRYFPMHHELDGESDYNREWIFVDIPHNLDGIDFLLLKTEHINVPEWGSRV
jgi:hypothetical protein